MVRNNFWASGSIRVQAQTAEDCETVYGCQFN